MGTQELQNILKSRSFKSTNHSGQSFRFTFTHVHILREGDIVANYDIEEINEHYFMKLSNLKSGIGIGDFKNVLLVSDNVKVLLNYDKAEFQMKGRIDITLVGE